MPDIEELIDDLISAVREDCAAYEWGSAHTNDIEKARAALIDYCGEWTRVEDDPPGVGEHVIVWYSDTQAYGALTWKGVHDKWGCPYANEHVTHYRSMYQPPEPTP